MTPRMTDAIRVTRAIATNQLARYVPQAYVRLTGQTGRGDAGAEDPAGIAGYFRTCVQDYHHQLAAATPDTDALLRGKVLMEYGPGDFPGVAALMVAHGAEKVYCVDRFPMVRLSPKNVRVLDDLVAHSHGPARERLLSCLADRGDPRAGFNPSRIEYLVQDNGLSRLQGAVDLVFSRAVLEHVNDLEATFDDMLAAMRPGAFALHQVDLQSHGLHRENPLDFLAWSPALWDLMYSAKGVPNRWRVDKYRQIVARLPVEVQTLAPTRLAAAEAIAGVRPMLDPAFRTLSDADLSWLGFWLLLRKEAR